MYKFKTYCSEDGLWFTNEEEIRALAADVDKAINIIVKPWEHLVPYTVWPIVVGGGCHERDTGYEAFSGGEYPWHSHWEERLMKEFNTEMDDLAGTWYSTLTFSKIIVVVLGYYGPIVLQFESGEMAVTISYDDDDKDEERKLLNELEAAFGKKEGF